MRQSPLYADADTGVEPIIIGGVGGSGTRVFAEILRATGCHIGGNLNDALDFVTFRLLTAGAAQNKPTIETIERIGRLARREPMRRSDAQELLATAKPLRGSRRSRAIRLRQIVGALADRGRTIEGPWGFKAPRTARLLPELATAFPEMRYIHVVRHGLDMALSSNINQLREWGPSLGVTWSGDAKDRPLAQLEYWRRANEETHRIGTDLLGDRYLLVRFDDVTADPAGATAPIAGFLGFDGPVSALVEGVRVPESAGRWRAAADAFSDHEIAAVAAWGFDTTV